MRYSLLSFAVCPMCHGDLVCVAVEEARAPLTEGLFPHAERVNAGRGIGPVPSVPRETAMSSTVRPVETFSRSASES